MRGAVVALLGVCLVFGCIHSAGERRARYLAENPGVRSDIADAVRNGAIKRGMTKDDVRASWGDPCGYCLGTRSSSWGDVWEYNVFGSARPASGTYVYFDQRGVVVGWSGR